MRKARGDPDAIREETLILVALKSRHKLVSFLFNRRNKVQVSHGPRINNLHLLSRIKMRT
jgi:hypothetical protein